MAGICINTHPLIHDGTTQDQRFLNALDPGSTKIHELTLRDWMNFAYQFAIQLKFYNLNDEVCPPGKWADFMKSRDEIEALIKESGFVEDEEWLTTDERERILKKNPEGNIEPHLALFLSFLKLLRFPHDMMNDLTRRHLEFYYKEVLKLRKKPGRNDKVHLIFELAKNANREIIPQNTVMEAGNDKYGKSLNYFIQEELVVNRAKIALLKSVYHNAGSTIKYAVRTDSSDGLGAVPDGDFPQWQAFGDETWPAAKPGFALASPILLLKGGDRKIRITITIKKDTKKVFPKISCFQSNLKIFFSGEKGWIPASSLVIIHSPVKNLDTLEIVASLDVTQEAVIQYDQQIHGEHFTTASPVMRVLVNTGNPDGYSVYLSLCGSKLCEATIKVDVQKLTDITTENDDGKLDPSKPFLPFGAYPTSGSNFYLGVSEVLSKPWSSMKLNIEWKDKPDLKDYYEGYKSGSSKKTNVSGKQETLKKPAEINDDYFTVLIRYFKNGDWIPASDDEAIHKLFEKIININSVNVAEKKHQNGSKLSSGKGDFNFHQERHPSAFKSESKAFGLAKSDFLVFTLVKDFFHDEYPRLLTQKLLEKGETKELPNPPYTPVIRFISLDYSASETCDFVCGHAATINELAELYVTRSIQFFLEYPFGQSEQHRYLKKQCDFVGSSEIDMLPVYPSEGEFYIGLENAEPSDTVSILFQVAEGSENPLVRSFSAGLRIEWFILVRNEWKPLNNNFINGDKTNNLIRSGIIKFNIPGDADKTNTALDPGYIWLKARLPEQIKYNSVCKLIGVHAQAAEAEFHDNENELSHLSDSLPADSIKKIIDKPPSIKGIKQPYCSFGGFPCESDKSFYIRVSERLRHKSRGINIWDYERLILQAFPSVYKVKCMSHTSIVTETGDPDYFELSPGFVSAIIVPDVRNRNCFDYLKPRVNSNLLREISNYISAIIPMHVVFQASNPEFEIIHCDFRVRFKEGYDANAYMKILNEDLIRFLSPWAFNRDIELHFGGRLYKSEVIRYIEDRSYVDFISKFRLLHRREESNQLTEEETVVLASDARSILVSDNEHTIYLIDIDKVCDE